MAKKFLDILGDAYDEEALEDVIPKRKKPAAKPKAKTSAKPKRRKKRFFDVLGANLPEEETSLTKKTGVKKTAGSSKSLLDTMEEALDNQVFDDLFPVASKKPQSSRSSSPPSNLESRFSTMITTAVLQRAREIAQAKGVRVKEVINAALKLYIEKELAD